MLYAVNVYLLASLVFVITFILFIPFISLLYRFKLQDPFRKKHRKDRFGQVMDVFDKIKAHKSGTPTGGGILIVLVVLFIYTFLYYGSAYEISREKYLLFTFSLIIFGLMGFYDDFKKVFRFRGLALRVRHKLLIQLSAGSLISYWGVTNNLFRVNIPFFNFEVTSFWLLFAISVLTIIFLSNAFNIIDGIDGLSSGSLLITLLTLGFFVSNTTGDLADLTFVFVVFGAVLAYLYFNINPARLFMGDTGALALGSIIGVLTLTTGTFYLLPVFGFVYIVDASTSLIQWFSLYFRGKTVFKIAPLHHHFEAIGWNGTKVVFRFWLVQAFASLLSAGLFYLFV